jgi:hypothetical protein
MLIPGVDFVGEDALFMQQEYRQLVVLQAQAICGIIARHPTYFLCPGGFLIAEVLYDVANKLVRIGEMNIACQIADLIPLPMLRYDAYVAIAQGIKMRNVQNITMSSSR